MKLETSVSIRFTEHEILEAMVDTIRLHASMIDARSTDKEMELRNKLYKIADWIDENIDKCSIDTDVGDFVLMADVVSSEEVSTSDFQNSENQKSSITECDGCCGCGGGKNR